MVEQVFLKTVKAGATFLRPIVTERQAVYIIEPGKSDLFEFEKPKNTDWVPTQGPMIKYANCEIAVTYVNFSGISDVNLFQCPKGTKYFLADDN